MGRDDFFSVTVFRAFQALHDELLSASFFKQSLSRRELGPVGAAEAFVHVIIFHGRGNISAGKSEWLKIGLKLTFAGSRTRIQIEAYIPCVLIFNCTNQANKQ